MKVWIIEHPTRGILDDYDYFENPPKPKFKWSIATTEGLLFFTLERAAKELENIVKSGGNSIKRSYIREIDY